MFVEALGWFPWYFLLTLGLVVLIYRFRLQKNHFERPSCLKLNQLGQRCILMKRHPTVAIAAASFGQVHFHAADWNQYHGIQSDKKTTEAPSTAFPPTDSKSWKVPTPSVLALLASSGNGPSPDRRGRRGRTHAEVCIALDTKTAKKTVELPAHSDGLQERWR